MTNKSIFAKPFLKWAGGKTQILVDLASEYPPQLKEGKIHNYIEPFLGGGAVFFDIAQRFNFNKAFLRDINKDLILTYNIVKNNVSNLVEALATLQGNYYKISSEKQSLYFYKVRELYNNSAFSTYDDFFCKEAVIRASQLIFLNRTCFNGLFRTNNKGQFNVPFGNYKRPKIADSDNLKNVSETLSIASIESSDFETIKEIIDENSFVYFDPPYKPISKTSSFTTYSKSTFSDKEQKRLANLCKQLHKMNCKFLLSNSDPKNNNPNDNFFDDLYSDKFFNIKRIQAKRIINCQADKRGKISEIIIKNY